MLLAMHHQGSSPIVFEQQRVGETGIVPQTKLPSSSCLIEHQSLTCKPMTVDVRRTCLEDSSYLSLSDTGEGSCSVRRCRSTICLLCSNASGRHPIVFVGKLATAGEPPTYVARGGRTAIYATNQAAYQRVDAPRGHHGAPPGASVPMARL